MEDNRDSNYDQEDRNYTDAPSTTDFEKSKLNDDPNQAYVQNAEQFEEFSSDHPNRPDYTEGSKSNGADEQNWSPQDNSERGIDDGLNTPNTLYNPDEDFESDNDRARNPDIEAGFEEDLEDDDDDEVDDERDFDEFEEDEDDDEDNEKSNVDDDWINREI